MPEEALRFILAHAKASIGCITQAFSMALCMYAAWFLC
jgi:hypothetical protein